MRNFLNFIFGIFVLSGCSVIQVSKGYRPTQNQSEICKASSTQGVSQAARIPFKNVTLYAVYPSKPKHTGFVGPLLLPIFPAFWNWEQSGVNKFNLRFVLENLQQQKITFDFPHWKMTTATGEELLVLKMEIKNKNENTAWGNQKPPSLISSTSETIEGYVEFGATSVTSHTFSDDEFKLEVVIGVGGSDFPKQSISWRKKKDIHYDGFYLPVGDEIRPCVGFPKRL